MITRRLQYEAAGRVVGPVLMAIDNWSAARRKRKRGKRDTPFGPPLECTRKLKDLIAVNYFQGRYADGAVPVTWVSSGFPVEVFRPLGYHVVYPENHGALCGTRRMTTELSEVAERDGYSRDLCSYARADIGSVLSGKTPVGRLPKPDLLACCTNICQTLLYWYRSLANHFKVPLILVDTPYVYGEAEPHHIEYVKDQLVELIEVAEKIAGRKTDPEELARVMDLSRDGSNLWKACLDAGEHRPSPWTGFDGFIHMAPVVALRGTEACNAYYRLLKAELDDRIARGISGIKNERYRLLWDNLPVWFKIRELSTLFAENGFNFVSTTYTNGWGAAGEYIDPADPIDSAARAYTYIILNRDLPNKLQLMKELIERYQIDGAVLHSDRSCKPYSIGQLDIKSRLSSEAGIKVVLLEADHADPRAYSEEQINNRLQAFMESFS